MMREVIEEARQTAQEMPAFAVAFVLLAAMCIGVHCAVFYEADGEQLKLVTHSDTGGNAVEGSEAIRRMRAHVGCSLKTPGITVVVGLRQYNMELSVPAASVRSLFESARRDVVYASVLEIDGTA